MTTEQEGEATHLDRNTMASTHVSNLLALEDEGEQILTAANGDVLTAEFAGQYVRLVAIQPARSGRERENVHPLVTPLAIATARRHDYRRAVSELVHVPFGLLLTAESET